MDLLINDSEDETQARNSGADQVSSIRLYHGVSGWKFLLLYRMVGRGATMQAQVWSILSFLRASHFVAM